MSKTFEFVRHSETDPGYVLLQYTGSRVKVIAQTEPAGSENESSLSDGEVLMPTGEVRQVFILQDDGLDLDADLEYHVENLLEEMRILIEDAKAEFVL